MSGMNIAADGAYAGGANAIRSMAVTTSRASSFRVKFIQTPA
jgi:hypothetical protein